MLGTYGTIGIDDPRQRRAKAPIGRLPRYQAVQAREAHGTAKFYLPHDQIYTRAREYC